MAHKLAQLRISYRMPACQIQNMISGGHQVGRCVHQRSIKIKYQGFNWHKGSWVKVVCAPISPVLSTRYHKYESPPWTSLKAKH